MRSSGENTLWIITEADRRVTTFLLRTIRAAAEPIESRAVCPLASSALKDGFEAHVIVRFLADEDIDADIIQVCVSMSRPLTSLM